MDTEAWISLIALILGTAILAAAQSV